jgi:redox-sensitive bicupin YhaK (pirin superfamily)
MTPRPSPRESASAAAMSAGTGILHSEKNDAGRLQDGDEHRGPAHFVPMWVVPDEDGSTPGHEQFEIDDALLTGGLIPVPSGMGRHRGAARAPSQHLFVPRNTVPLEGTGDAVHRHRHRRSAVHRHRGRGGPRVGDARDRRHLSHSPVHTRKERP